MDHASADVLRDAFEALDEGVAIYDADRRLVGCNARTREMLAAVSDMLEPGARWEDILQACAHRGVYTDSESAQAEWLAYVTGASSGQEQRVELRHADGGIYTVAFHPTRGGGFVVLRTDVTEQRAEESAMAERERMLSIIVNTNPVAVTLAQVDDGEIVYRSPAAARLFGRSTHASAHYPEPGSRERYVSAIRKEGEVHDYRVNLQVAGGRTIPAAIHGRLTEYNGVPCILSVITDLSLSEEHEALIRRVVQSCPAPILMTRARSGRILFKSPEIDVLFGDAEVTTDYYENPADRAGFLAALRRDGQVLEYRARFRNAAGETFWGAISARLIEYQGEEVIVSYSRDLTNQFEIEEELRQQREQLFQNEKMTALGGLLAGVAHELNNPLSVVVGHAMMLGDETADPEVRRQTQKISEAAARCTKIVRTFLTMARQEPTRVEKTDLNSVVSTAVDVASYGDGGAHLDVEYELATDLPPVLADADQITQVVINLILNAEQSIQEAGTGGRILTRTRSAPDGRHAIIEVEDDGPGVPPELRKRIFDPFFTTKNVGDGTGIGLAFCHRVVTTHKGQIRVDPEYEDGARFVIQLPISDAPVPVATSPIPETKGVVSARVLVIDDEHDVADLNAEVLSRVGYEVTTAYSANDAVELLRKANFDAVVSDLNMPGLDGRGFFEIIQQDFRHLLASTGFITGDTMGRASQGFLRESKRPYLEKPVAPGELRDFVAGLLTAEEVE